MFKCFCLVMLLLLAGHAFAQLPNASTGNITQTPKTVAVPSGELKLNDAENKALDGFNAQLQELDKVNKSQSKELNTALENQKSSAADGPKAVTDAAYRTIIAYSLLIDNGKKTDDLIKEFQTWLTAVRNRLKCDDCVLDADARSLKNPVKADQAKPTTGVITSN